MDSSERENRYHELVAEQCEMIGELQAIMAGIDGNGTDEETTDRITELHARMDANLAAIMRIVESAHD